MLASLSGETGAMTPDPSLVRVTYVPHRRSVYPEVLTQHFRVSLRLNRHISAIYTQHNQNYTSPTFKLTQTADIKRAPPPTQRDRPHLPSLPNDRRAIKPVLWPLIKRTGLETREMNACETWCMQSHP